MLGPAQPSIQLRALEEAMTLFGAIVVAALAYSHVGHLFRYPMLAAGLTGILSAFALAYLTSSCLTLTPPQILYCSRFRQDAIRLADVSKVGVQKGWALLPHQSIVLLMQPTAPVAGRIFRVGMLTSPGARQWVTAVNAAIQGSPSIPN
jgi:hypothetical protein